MCRDIICFPVKTNSILCYFLKKFLSPAKTMVTLGTIKTSEIGDRFFMYQIAHVHIHSHIYAHITENTIFNARVVYKMNELLQISPTHSRITLECKLSKVKKGGGEAPCVCVCDGQML